MRIIGHGIDMVEIARIQTCLDSPHKKWAERVYSADEREQADQSPQHVRYYAGRFAGKEAVGKALGTGFSGEVTWRGIEILRLPSGAPEVRLTGGVLDVATGLGITRFLISISYSGGFAIASAIAVGD
jgi:holo-[acyl-carrier protein] synthase